MVEKDKKIIGSVCLADKRYSTGGKGLRAAYLHGMRIRPDYQKRPVRAFFQVYSDVMDTLESRGYDFAYGLVKADNKRMHRFATRRRFMRFAEFNLLMIPSTGRFVKNDLGCGEPEVLSRGPLHARVTVPERCELLVLAGVVFTYEDFSDMVSIRVKKISPFFVFLLKVMLGPGPVRQWEENRRTFTYRLVQVLACESQRALKDFLEVQRALARRAGVHFLGVVNRTGFKVRTPIRNTIAMYIRWLKDQPAFEFEDLVIDLADM